MGRVRTGSVGGVGVGERMGWKDEVFLAPILTMGVTSSVSAANPSRGSTRRCTASVRWWSRVSLSGSSAREEGTGSHSAHSVVRSA